MSLFEKKSQDVRCRNTFWSYFSWYKKLCPADAHVSLTDSWILEKS